MGHKVALNFLSSAAGPRITPKAGLLVLTLGFTGTVQSVAVLMRVSALKQAALVAPGFATTLALDILASVPSLAFRYTQYESRVSNYLLYFDPDDLTTFSVADRDRMCSWSRNSQFLPPLHPQFVQPEIMCNNLPWGPYHWETELDHNAGRGVWRAAVPVSDCISTSLYSQSSRTLTPSARHVYAPHDGVR